MQPKFRALFFSLLVAFLLFCIFLSIIFTDHSPLKNQLNLALFTFFLMGALICIFLICELRIKELKNKTQRLDSDLNKAIFDLMALFEFTTVLSSDLRLNQMIELMVDTIKRIHCYDGCCLFFYDEQHQEFNTKVNRDFPEKINKTNLPIKDLPGGSLIKSGQAMFINNIENEYPNLKIKGRNFRELLGQFNSFLLLPLVFERKLIGLIILAKYTAAAYLQDDLRLLLIISNQIGLAIQNRILYEQVYYSAITDGLTGIYNQKYFREQLELQLEKAREYNFKISLILIDIDYFKRFNDSYGHQVGDKVLKEVSKVIQECVNPDSLVARYGGEEFVVILPDATIEAATIVAEKIRSTVEKHHVDTSDYSNLQVTISLGIATFPDHIKNMRRMVGELIDIADDNLYSAKNAGRNRICIPTNV